MLYFLNGLVAKTARHSSAKGIRGGANPPQASRHYKCPSGVIGSRRRLKISRPQGHVGSTPTSGTQLNMRP